MNTACAFNQMQMRHMHLYTKKTLTAKIRIHDMTAPNPAAVDTAPTGFRNTNARFGHVAKTFHWASALLIITLIPLGLIAQNWPYDTAQALHIKASLFSVHKTLGVTVFFVALARIIWAIIQPRPVLLNATHKVQNFAADTVHFALYGALVIVPLSGWFHHAATSGFAPIWWPFGQNLFFVPQSETLAKMFSHIHFAANVVLVAALGLHIAGALKHHVIDRDATLRRMLPGSCDLPDHMIKTSHHTAPALMAIGIWAAAIGIALGASAPSNAPSNAPPADQAPTLAQVASQWQVTQGNLGITVQQFGQAVTGEFSDWTANIAFDPQAQTGILGNVTVTVAIGSLTLGGVTQQALGDEFLQSNTFETAIFTGPITATNAGYVVEGTLNLAGETLPLTLPFDLTLEGDTATAQGATQLNRLDFGIGTAYRDENSVGFGVDIQFDLTATRDMGA
jgi:cytochrome b561/polyisoprenoid-binding protein YceI